MLEFCVCELSQQNILRLDRDPDQLVIQHGGRVLPFQLHPQRWSIRGGVFRPQQDNGGEHILNHPLHGAVESSLRPLRRRRHMVGADACSADVRRHRFPAVQRQPPLGQCHRIPAGTASTMFLHPESRAADSSFSPCMTVAG